MALKRSYSALFKLNVLSYVEMMNDETGKPNGIAKAARDFDIGKT